MYLLEWSLTPTLWSMIYVCQLGVQMNIYIHMYTSNVITDSDKITITTPQLVHVKQIQTMFMYLYSWHAWECLMIIESNQTWAMYIAVCVYLTWIMCKLSCQWLSCMLCIKIFIIMTVVLYMLATVFGVEIVIERGWPVFNSVLWRLSHIVGRYVCIIIIYMCSWLDMCHVCILHIHAVYYNTVWSFT